MIKSIRVEGFKRFKDETFHLKSLTILAGLNGSGKSSFIQSILLTKEASNGAYTVPLDTAFGLDLGTAQDVINWNNSDEEINISFDLESELQRVYTFVAPNSSSLYLNVKNSYSENLIKSINHTFIYLSAERYGPKSEYRFTSKHIDELALGLNGEHCAQIIDSIGLLPVLDADRIHPSTPENEAIFINYQLERWLSEIVRPIKIRSEKYGSNTTSSLQFKVDNSEWVKASNMGFGITYVLPIILAGLIIKKDGLLIIENPEAHLHPAGQSKIGEYIGWISGKGVQVLVETHSDHVLNGIRKAIVEKNYLDHSDANVLFFDTEDGISTIKEIYFTEHGGLTGWPKSFFDQYQIDTTKLGSLRRSKIKNVIRN